MRLVEIRLLEGPNVYRLEPVVKVEIAIGRRRTWYGRRDPERHALVQLGKVVPASDWPAEVAGLVAWIRRLRLEAGEGRARLEVHSSSDPGHWIVTWPWQQADRAQVIADAAVSLAGRGVPVAADGRLTDRQARRIRDWSRRVTAAEGRPPAWIRDSERRIPVISISGTNGKSTTTRLVSRILSRAGRRVGTTNSDGIMVGKEIVEPGDWTGPGGAHAILERSDVDVAVLETARGGIVLKGVGYESNDASILTNVTSDHLDLQGIHTLPELAEVKATICRITRRDGWVVLNADDRYVVPVARRVRASVAYFTLEGDRSTVVRRHLRAGRRAYLVRDGMLGEAEGAKWRPIAEVREVPIAFGGFARHNIANALAASAGARALGATIAEVRRGLLDFRPTAGASPGRLNVFRADSQVVIVDFAHNEAGIYALFDVAEAIAGSAPVTAIIGTAGDRPDDTLRGMGRIAAERASRIAIKETLTYLRGRSRAGVIGEIRAGAVGAGWKDEIPVYESEPAALQGELDHGETSEDQAPRIIALLCHEDRDGVFKLLGERGFQAVDSVAELSALLPETRSSGSPKAPRRRSR